MTNQMETLKKDYEQQKICTCVLERKITVTRENVSKLVDDVNTFAEKVEGRTLEKKWGANGTEKNGLDADKETSKLVDQLTEMPDLLESVLASLRRQQAKMNEDISDVKSSLQQLRVSMRDVAAQK
ncbi:uncharacterized protein LOC144453710 isoform X2 [Glandiceps talaboti]